jgi:hypothetical protein
MGYNWDCPKEGWWGEDKLRLDLEVSADAGFMAGMVTPGRTVRVKLLKKSIALSTRVHGVVSEYAVNCLARNKESWP